MKVKLLFSFFLFFAKTNELSSVSSNIPTGFLENIDKHSLQEPLKLPKKQALSFNKADDNYGGKDFPEITISLPTAKRRPLYISCPNPSLKEIFMFDFNQSGTIAPIFDDEIIENKLKHQKSFEGPFWKKQPFSYILKLTKDKTSFIATLFSKEKEKEISLGSYPFKHSLASNRRFVHTIVDRVYRLIEGVEGIATTKIYYAVQFRDQGKWKSEIWCCDYDGANASPLTEEKSYCIHPVLFPQKGAFTKDKYLYVNYKLGQSKIYISSFNKKRGKPFLFLRGNQLLPTLSPKGDTMAFISDASGQADLFIQSFDAEKGLIGKPRQIYSFPNSVQASPTFSPDGSQIAFVSDQQGSPRIFVISLKNLSRYKRPQAICLTTKHKENICPSWSPDGNKLAYSAKIDGIRQIMIYNFILKKEVQLTNGKSHKENPSWAPNSMHIIFNTIDSYSSELFLINLKQKKMIQITKGPGRKHYPYWGPLKN